ncbi:MAG: GNAT family N-acetyltransferase [Coriobacteriales bacterium]|nr:GNAT family N-acetyltransferase [Coriobacteriales bacterium]
MDYQIIDGADKMNIDEVVKLLKASYWANKRSKETIERSMRNSSCYGVYLNSEHKLVGFARVISDYATTYYLCDVIIDQEWQHRGLGTALVSYIESRPEYEGLRGLLLTRDALAFYEQFGYKVLDGRAMSNRP